MAQIWNLRNLPITLHKKVIEAYRNNDIVYLRYTFLLYKVASCQICLTNIDIKTKTKFAIDSKIWI